MSTGARADRWVAPITSKRGQAGGLQARQYMLMYICLVLCTPYIYMCEYVCVFVCPQLGATKRLSHLRINFVRRFSQALYMSAYGVRYQNSWRYNNNSGSKYALEVNVKCRKDIIYNMCMYILICVGIKRKNALSPDPQSLKILFAFIFDVSTRVWSVYQIQI